MQSSKKGLVWSAEPKKEQALAYAEVTDNAAGEQSLEKASTHTFEHGGSANNK